MSYREVSPSGVVHVIISSHLSFDLKRGVSGWRMTAVLLLMIMFFVSPPDRGAQHDQTFKNLQPIRQPREQA